MSLGNSAALEAANITRATRDVAGGTIVRTASGEPTGVLKDNAAEPWIRRAETASGARGSRARRGNGLRRAQGVTSVHNMGRDDLAVFERAHKADRLERDLRSRTVVDLGAIARYRSGARAWRCVASDRRAGGSSTPARPTPPPCAAVHRRAKDTGLFVSTPDNLYRWVSGADKPASTSWCTPSATAPSGPSSIFERVAKENGPARRFRIEHAQHIAAPDFPRFARLGVIASMQPYHAIDDGRWAGQGHWPGTIERDVCVPVASRCQRRWPSGAIGSSRRRLPERIYAATTRGTIDDRNPGGWVPWHHGGGGPARVYAWRSLRVVRGQGARRSPPARWRTSS